MVSERITADTEFGGSNLFLGFVHIWFIRAEKKTTTERSHFTH